MPMQCGDDDRTVRWRWPYSAVAMPSGRVSAQTPPRHTSTAAISRWCIGESPWELQARDAANCTLTSSNCLGEGVGNLVRVRGWMGVL